MENEPYIEFFTNKDEQAFFQAWEEKVGRSLSEDEWDDLFAEIADDISEKVKQNEHELGKPFEYKGVMVGKSDYNAFLNLYLFEKV